MSHIVEERLFYSLNGVNSIIIYDGDAYEKTTLIFRSKKITLEEGGGAVQQYAIRSVDGNFYCALALLWLIAINHDTDATIDVVDRREDTSDKTVQIDSTRRNKSSR